MLRRTLLAALPALGLTPAACAQPSTAPEGSLQRILDDTRAPAVGGVVIGEQGVIHAEAAGVRRLKQPEPVTTNEVWHIGSNTKAMTAALYALQVQAGKAKWGATLAELFPDLTLDPAWKATPIEALLGHRAGVQDKPVMIRGWLSKAHADKRPLVEQRTALAAEVLSQPPTGPAGAFGYSNVGYILAGAALERITGQPWEQALSAQLFQPLGMTSAGFGAPKGANAWGHRPAFGLVGELEAVDPGGLADNPPALGPAGTCHMTLADHGKFARLFFGEPGLLNADSVRRLTAAVPGRAEPDGEPSRPYALGWGLASQPWSKGTALAHEGSNTLWHEVVIVAPGRKLAIITACNAAPAPSKNAALKLAERLQKMFADD